MLEGRRWDEPRSPLVILPLALEEIPEELLGTISDLSGLLHICFSLQVTADIGECLANTCSEVRPRELRV